ncbi:MAG: D-alanyl-D-alanine carboxypeptidase family protein [Acidimicrobiales bacterium]
MAGLIVGLVRGVEAGDRSAGSRRMLVRSLIGRLTIRPAAGLVVWSVTTTLLGGPAAADETADEVAGAVAATDLSPDEMFDAFDDAVLDGLADIGPAPAITSDATTDARIRATGEARGYRRRPLPSRDLAPVDGILLQPAAAAAWEQLQAAARDAGHSIWITSGFRDVAAQRTIFRRRLSGTSDTAIDRRLRTAAVPGYSKHHTGYAIDIRSSTGSRFAFAGTAAYTWLAADNWANAKAYGWLPSYPEGGRPAGPVPEPWELVWVGATNIICADSSPAETAPFCDTVGSPFANDIAWLLDHGITAGCRADRFCPQAAITRGQMATMLWRRAGEPAADGAIPFVDVADGAFYSAAVRWMYATGSTTGVSPTRFEPERPLTRAELVTFLWRVAGRPEPAGDAPLFGDVDVSSFSAAAVRWAASTGVTRGTSATEFSPERITTRGEAAAFVHRHAAAASDLPGIDGQP